MPLTHCYREPSTSCLLPQGAIIVHIVVSRTLLEFDGCHSGKGLFNAIHQETIIKVDFIIRKDSPYRRVEFGRRSRVTHREITFWITSKEDLIISKLYWAKDSESELQLRDVRNLPETGCDLGYLNHWIKELDLGLLWKKCL